MNSKERIHAVLEGKPVDRMPVTVLYNHLYHLDHFAELTGRPAWQRHSWLCATPDEHVATFRQMSERAPFEILEPQSARSRAGRERIEFFEKEGSVYRRDRQDGTVTRVPETVAGHASDYAANETQTVFDAGDFNRQFRLEKAGAILDSGCLDYVQAAVQALGREQFILSGGIVSMLWSCIRYLGQTNMLTQLIDNPGLIDYMGQKILEQSMEYIRAFAAAGGDGLFIDDAMGYSDVISVAHYERFSLPYLKAMVQESHRFGLKVILIYFGGVSDRLEQIVSTGADGLSMETSMKSYVNDIHDIARKIGRRITLFGNVDPIGILQNAGDARLEAEIRRQAQAAQYARGFVMCTGSPITPATPLSRVQRFLALGRTCMNIG